MTALLRIAVSIRTTVVLMLLVSLLLLVSVAVPQRAVYGSETLSTPLMRVLGLDAVATSPLFVALLVLFYVNLVAVMVHRMPRTLGRLRVHPPTAEALQKWIASPRAIEGTSSAPLAPAIVVATLRGFGFRPHGVSGSAMYAVKHRTAAIGFLLFHASFLFLCAGGLLIWYTRFVGEMRIVEGQRMEANDARVLRRPPGGNLPSDAFTLEKMTPAFENGEATDLRAAIRFDDEPPTEAWVNHPAERGPLSLLVTDVGLAPVLWLQDARGFGVDRVAAPADRNDAVEVPLAAGIVRVRIYPLPKDQPFPLRDSLTAIPLELVIHEGTREAFRGKLRAGEAASLTAGRVVLTEVRYWGGVRIVRERGGALLLLGFTLATIGAAWRLLMHRRDLVISWSGTSFRIAGHGEWFADRDRRELMALATAIERCAGEPAREAVRT